MKAVSTIRSLSRNLDLKQSRKDGLLHILIKGHDMVQLVDYTTDQGPFYAFTETSRFV